MKWIDLFGIDPDYTEGLSVEEFIARNRDENLWSKPAHTCPNCRRIVVRTDGHHCPEEES